MNMACHCERNCFAGLREGGGSHSSQHFVEIFPERPDNYDLAAVHSSRLSLYTSLYNSLDLLKISTCDPSVLEGYLFLAPTSTMSTVKTAAQLKKEAKAKRQQAAAVRGIESPDDLPES